MNTLPAVIPGQPVVPVENPKPKRIALIVIGNTLEHVSNCMDCTYHTVVKDPDKYDSFCSDDIAVLCGKTENVGPEPDRAWMSGEIWKYKAITTSCRPYNDRKECEIPEWCPSLVKEA